MLRKLESFFKYFEVFDGPFEVMKFRKAYKNNLTFVVNIKTRESRYPLFCRGNTTDLQVLWDTFYRKHHLPPIKLAENSTIVDLGANVGYTMAHFAYLFPKSSIYGVEMNYENFLFAKKNLEPLSDQCVLIHSAIWHENGFVLYGGDKEWGYSIVRNDNVDDKKQAPAKTLDVLFEENNIREVDYLKMDIEGAEKSVLEKPEKWIDRVKSMKIEIHPPATYDGCKEILERFSFSCSKDADSTLPNIVAISK